jgi:hypothetical protein
MPPIITQLASPIGDALTLPIKLIQEANLFVYYHLGFFGQLAFDLILFYVLCLVAYKATKAVFDVAFYVIVPSVALSVVSSFLLPFGFVSILPVCVVVLIVVNIIRS